MNKQHYVIDMSGYIISVHRSREAAHNAMVKATTKGIKFIRCAEGFGKKKGDTI